MSKEKRDKFFSQKRVQFFMGELFAYTIKDTWKEVSSPLIEKVNWHRQDADDFFKKVYAGAKISEKEQDLLSFLINHKNPEITTMALAFVLIFVPEQALQFFIMYETHPDDRLRRGWRMFQNKGEARPQDFRVGHMPKKNQEVINKMMNKIRKNNNVKIA